MGATSPAMQEDDPRQIAIAPIKIIVRQSVAMNERTDSQVAGREQGQF